MSEAKHLTGDGSHEKTETELTKKAIEVFDLFDGLRYHEALSVLDKCKAMMRTIARLDFTASADEINWMKTGVLEHAKREDSEWPIFFRKADQQPSVHKTPPTK